MGDMNLRRFGIVMGGAALAMALASTAAAETIIFNYVITNTSGQTQTVTITNNLLFGGLAGPTVMSGSITGTVTDLNGSTALVTSNPMTGTSIYTAFIDDVEVYSLMNPTMDNPFAFSATGPFQSGTGGPESFTAVAGPGVISKIGIRLDFTLSHGDSASFTSIFTVIPAPGAIAVLGLGVGLVRRRRS